MTVVFAIAYAIHVHHVNRAVRDHSDPNHDAMMETLHDYRQERGF